MPVSAVYLPGSRHELTISEPRYRELYDDMLMTGSRRFMVTCLCEGRLARYGVVFHLDDLREISEDTQDRIKYVGTHSVRDRARLMALLNPHVWHDRSTYLRGSVEVVETCSTVVDDEIAMSRNRALVRGAGEEGSLGPGGDPLHALHASLSEIVGLQQELDEEPRFMEHALNARGFWELCGLWGTLAERRLQVRVQQLHADVQRRIRDWADRHPEQFEQMKKDLSVVPEDIRSAGARAREVYAEGAGELRGAFQRVLQCNEEEQRIAMVATMMEAERRRLLARRSLKELFGPSA